MLNIFAVVLFSFSFTATLHVPDQYQTINLAFRNAEANDTIFIAQGTYYVSEFPSQSTGDDGMNYEWSYLKWPKHDNVHLVGELTEDGEIGVVLDFTYNPLIVSYFTDDEGWYGNEKNLVLFNF